MVPKESVDHMAHGDRQGGNRYIERAYLQSFVVGFLLRGQAGQLQGSHCPKGTNNIFGPDHFCLAREDALGKEIVDIGVRV